MAMTAYVLIKAGAPWKEILPYLYTPGTPKDTWTEEFRDDIYATYYCTLDTFRPVFLSVTSVLDLEDISWNVVYKVALVDTAEAGFSLDSFSLEYYAELNGGWYSAQHSQEPIYSAIAKEATDILLEDFDAFNRLTGADYHVAREIYLALMLNESLSVDWATWRFPGVDVSFPAAYAVLRARIAKGNLGNIFSVRVSAPDSSIEVLRIKIAKMAARDSKRIVAETKKMASPAPLRKLA
jgi:hypothetical protein